MKFIKLIGSLFLSCVLFFIILLVIIDVFFRFLSSDTAYYIYNLLNPFAFLSSFNVIITEFIMISIILTIFAKKSTLYFLKKINKVVIDICTI